MRNATTTRRRLGAFTAVAGLGLAAAGAASAAGASAADHAGAGSAAASAVRFKMVRSLNAASIGCLPKATAVGTITPLGAVEQLNVVADGLPANTDFDLFVIQVPNSPFGLSWYEGDVETDAHGHADQTFVGRFSVETFTVAPGAAPAPVVHRSPIADAATNPATAPVHQYHVGLWFNSATDAAKAGCQNTVTPFNGEHNAGVQAMSTRTYADATGPLRRVTP